MLCSITAAAEEDDTLKKKTMIEVASKQIPQEEKDFLLAPESYDTWFDFESLVFDANTKFVKMYWGGTYNDKFFSSIARGKSLDEIFNDFDIGMYGAVNNNGYWRVIEKYETRAIDVTENGSFYFAPLCDLFLSEASICVDNKMIAVDNLYYLRTGSDCFFYYSTDTGIYVSYYPTYTEDEYYLFTLDEFNAKVTEYVSCKDDIVMYPFDFSTFLEGDYYFKDSNETNIEINENVIIICVFSAAVFALGAVSYILNSRSKSDSEQESEPNEKQM